MPIQPRRRCQVAHHRPRPSWFCCREMASDFKFTGSPTVVVIVPAVTVAPASRSLRKQIEPHAVEQHAVHLLERVPVPV